MADGISKDVERFVERHIQSVSQLELLLLLRTAPDQTWSAEQIAREMRVELVWAQAQLVSFCERGLVERLGEGSTEFRYRPRTPELEKAVTELARAAVLHRVRLIELIYSRPSDHLRAFADAFKLRKETDG
jgi:hypothetical protein